MLKRILIAIVLAAALALPLALYAQEDEFPEMVLAAYPGLHPEGIDWDAERGVFVVGSIPEGGVFTVADDGTVTRLAEGHEGLGSTGVHVDTERNRVLVTMPDFTATQDPEATGSAALAAYDLDTGEELFFVDLTDLDPGRDFANDVAVDAEGNAYFTTSFSGVIYRVDPEGNGEIFLAADEFAVEGFGLNGIDYHPEGNYLLVAVAGSGSIYKVPVDDPESYTQVTLDASVSIDGMVLGADGNRLYAVASVDGAQAREIVMLTTEDDWASATVAARQEAQSELSPTTLALRDPGGIVYVTHAKFGEIGSDPPVETFEIQRFDFFDMTGDTAPAEEATEEMTEEAIEEAAGEEMGATGDQLVNERCTVCHTRERIDMAQKSREEWAATVDRMIGNGAQLSPEEREIVIEYLASR